MADTVPQELNNRTEEPMNSANSDAEHAAGKETLRENGLMTNGTGDAKKEVKEHRKSSEHRKSEHRSSHHKSGEHKKSDHHRSKDEQKKERTSDHKHEQRRHSKGDESRKHRKDSSPDKVKVKSEPGTDPSKSTSAAGRINSDDDDKPLVERKVKSEPNLSHKRSSGHDLDDEPLTSRFDAKKVKVEKEVKKEHKEKRHKSSEHKKSHHKEHKHKGKEEGKKEKPREKHESKKHVKQEPLKKKRKAEDQDDSPAKKKKKKNEPATGKSPTKKKEEPQAWRWWEEGPKEAGVKWRFLEHKGPLFAPAYEPLPKDVKFYYNSKVMKLTPDTEEVAGFFAKMLDHDYTTRKVFRDNFFKDWRKVMSKEEKDHINDLNLCNFKELADYFKMKSEVRKAMSKEEKKQLKEENAKIQEEYGWCMMDGHKQKIGNFRIEPPGLFRGRGDHPKQGCLKKRVVPEQVLINCSKDAKAPPPPKGRKWAEVRHDNGVTWLASWNENVQGQVKYVMLAPTSRLKGEKDWKKYQMAQKLHKIIDKIRDNYRNDWKSKEMRVRQRAVAMYFIDKLALRAGNEKDEDTADTVGCCSIRVEHITLHDEKGGKEFVVEFDFLGKDSIRYHNEVSVEKRVYKNVQLFMDNKAGGDDLFDRLNTGILNKHLSSIMDGLSAKVFRTYNASRTLQEQLELLTDPDDPVASKVLAYNRANRAVAILCNHQRSAPKTFDKQMENMQAKIDAKQQLVNECKKEVKQAKADLKALKTATAQKNLEKKKKALERTEDQLQKLEIQMTDKSENKEIALGTSKLNYLDPRISVAWCKKWNVPIEKVYNKTQREKFAWAIDMADEDFRFTDYNEKYSGKDNGGGDGGGDEEEEDDDDESQDE